MLWATNSNILIFETTKRSIHDEHKALIEKFNGLHNTAETRDAIYRALQNLLLRQGFENNIVKGKCLEFRLTSWWYIDAFKVYYSADGYFTTDLSSWYEEYLHKSNLDFIYFNNNGCAVVLTDGDGLFVFDENKRIQPPREHL